MELCREGGFWKYPGKRRFSFDLKAGTLGGGAGPGKDSVPVSAGHFTVVVSLSHGDSPESWP